MKKLFKGRYIIARYDENDLCTHVSENPWGVGLDASTIFRGIQHGETEFDVKNGKCYLIDCLEIHDDIFKEEDELFLKDIDFRTRGEKIQQYSIENKIPLRTIYNRLSRGILNEKEL